MRRRREGMRARLAVGFLLLSWGGIMLITNVEATKWPLETWWPAMIISLGVFFLITPGNKYGWAVVSLISGGLALAANHGKITLDTVFVWWPSILVGIGLWIVFRAIVPERSVVTGKRRATTILDRTADQFSTVVSEPQMTGISQSDRASAEGGSNNRYSSRTSAGAPRPGPQTQAVPVVPMEPVVPGHTPARRVTPGQEMYQSPPAYAPPPPPSYQPASRYGDQQQQPEYTSVGRYLHHADPPPMHTPPPGYHQPPGPPMGLNR